MRLSKITTRTGDDGSTGLGDGSRCAKDSARITLLGEVDELNSVLGVVLSQPLPAPYADWLVAVQHDLFDCPRHKLHGVTQHMNNAKLDLSVRIDGVNGIREAL